MSNMRSSIIYDFSNGLIHFAHGPSVLKMDLRNGTVGKSGVANLSGTTGRFDGELRRDDGTNTAASGLYCHWDSANSQWVATDGATFT
jgi:hypothetical protein